MQKENIPIAKSLLKAHADVNKADSWGKTPLISAAKNSQLANKADVSRRDRFGIHPGKTALGYARQNKDEKTTPLLKNTGAKD